MAKNEQIYSVCTICDIGCQLRAETEDGKLKRMIAHDNPALARNVCYKGTAAAHVHNHADRLTKPLKRVGERGDDQWEEISYEQAMDEIAQRLKTLVAKYGPETLAVSTSGWNTQTTHSLDRRFMNALGSPNYISGVSLCAGNTAAVNKFTYGWFPFADIPNSKCIVLFGHNPRKHSWTPIFNMINQARANGAKVIVLDPRVSEQAEVADMHLSLRSGTDAAMMLGWLHVIINEELYDKDFVAEYTTGFEELRARVDEYPLDRVEEITGVPADLIAEAARLYATAESACIPWTPITDMQISSTSAIRLQSILRALTGNIDVPGGEILGGFDPNYIPESKIGNHEMLSVEQKAKQLGSDTHPAYTYRAQEMLSEHTERVYGYQYADIVMGCYMANPSSTFKAMATEKPYPVKAFFVLGNNALMSYPNQHQILEGMLNQELIVAHEIFMTPTAMLADYVLPGDVFSERNHISDYWNWKLGMTLSQKAVEPPPEASSTFEFWRDLGHRFGFEELFPWETIEDMLDYRLSPSGRTFAEFADANYMYINPPKYRKYREKGFATPSGKVELKSSVLEELGFDPLPYYREGPAVSDEYPYNVFTGVREDAFFQTGQRQVKVLRDRMPSPKLFMHPIDAARENIADHDWVKLQTATGEVTAKVLVKESMKEGHIRVPHGWWYPEMRGDAKLAGAFISSDAVLCPDDPEFLDYEQGIPHFKGFPGRIVKLAEPPAGMSEQVLAG
ncbi:molybdopterin-dependent oxidoreductase [Congregibacter sp.]|uniref:molybdopterin-containing oxidoreductase family protein n=1 Tax=Congregibacter sp. TaxID=2744308 RepID=UPI00385E7126